MNTIRDTVQLLLLRQGNKIELSNKPILLHFWDQMCPKCVEECIPEIVNVVNNAKYKNIFFLGICVNENGFTEKDLKKYNLTWPQVSITWNSFLIETLGITSIPTVVIDQENTIAISDSILSLQQILDTLKING